MLSLNALIFVKSKRRTGCALLLLFPTDRMWGDEEGSIISQRRREREKNNTCCLSFYLAEQRSMWRESLGIHCKQASKGKTQRQTASIARHTSDETQMIRCEWLLLLLQAGEYFIFAHNCHKEKRQTTVLITDLALQTTQFQLDEIVNTPNIMMIEMKSHTSLWLRSLERGYFFC